MKIFLAQQNYHIGNFKYNINKITDAIKAAKKDGADLIVFSELSICGYRPADFLYYDGFLNSCNEALKEIAQSSAGIAVLVGLPVKNENVNGKRLYNAACFIEDGVIKNFIKKTCLPTYDIFDEDRYFEPASSWELINFKGKKIAVTICEDIWNLGENPLYKNCPMDMLFPFGPDFIVNLSASPFDYTHSEDRMAVLKANALKYKIPIFYCNSVGSQTEVVFDGNSMVFDKDANLCGSLKSFEEDYQSFVCYDDGRIGHDILESYKSIPDHQLDPELFDASLNISKIYNALKSGLQDYFLKMGFKKAILGSSGGLDSAVTLAIACDAIGAENVTAILMPSQYSTTHSVGDAEALSINLKNPYSILPIENVYNALLQTLSPLYKDLPFGVAEENLQSRSRGNLLMGVANKFNYILLNTSNKSELATGYGTLYGDMAGGIAVLGDCYKTQVYNLAKYINRNSEIIPYNIITKPPSAELRPGQRDTDSLPQYEILDSILYQYIEKFRGPEEIINMGFEKEIVDRILLLVNRNEYKRNQFCPVIRISSKAFGIGRRMPIVANYNF